MFYGCHLFGQYRSCMYYRAWGENKPLSNAGGCCSTQNPGHLQEEELCLWSLGRIFAKAEKERKKKNSFSHQWELLFYWWGKLPVLEKYFGHTRQNSSVKITRQERFHHSLRSGAGLRDLPSVARRVVGHFRLIMCVRGKSPLKSGGQSISPPED